MEKFDLIIIGGGAGAFGAAIRANELKAKTLLVNDGLPLGGTCVNVGCVPSKHLLKVGEALYRSAYPTFKSVQPTSPSFDFAAAIAEKNEIITTLRDEKYDRVLKGLEYVTFLEGRAKFTSTNQIEVNRQIYDEASFIVATGSTATVPPIEGIREVGFVDHISAMEMKKLPASLIVIGGGPVGLEFAQMFAHFGSKVTLLQIEPSLLPRTEPEVSQKLREYLAAEGIEIQTDAKTKSARLEGGEKVLTVEIKGEDNEFRGEEILLAAGKTPNTDGLDLEIAQVEITDKKAIKVSGHLQTSNPRIFAVGDTINLPLRLETTAGHEGTLAAQNALTGSKESIDYYQVPYAVFTSPEVAGVGLTDEEVSKQLGACSCQVVSLEHVPKARAIKDTRGLIKMVVDPRNGKILGVHMVGPQAADIIYAATLAIQAGATTQDLANSWPVFPTLSEALKITAQAFHKDITKLSCCI